MDLINLIPNITPKVTVVVTHHLNENQKYLDLCVESILESGLEEFEVLVMCDTPERPKEITDYRVTYHWRHDVPSASHKVNMAVDKLSNPKSKYIMLISDDVMISAHTIEAMVKAYDLGSFIQNPMCNGDNSSQFYARLPWPIKLSAEELKSKEAVWSFPKLPDILVPRDFISFYCTMIPRHIWNEVGGLDPELDSRHNDQDWCYRARMKGYLSMVNFGAFALHFGDKTLPKITKPEDLDKCTDHFKRKWSIQ